MSRKILNPPVHGHYVDRCDASPAVAQQAVLEALGELGGRPTYQVLIYNTARKLKRNGLSTYDCRVAAFKACGELFSMKVLKRVRKRSSYDAVFLTSALVS